MLTKESLVTRLYVKEARNMFEDICNERESQKMDPRVFTILNYEKMVGDLAEYISGYIKYKEKGSNKYKGQVAGTTLQFYNRMFTDEKKYRRKFYLPDMKDIIKGFLEQTKKLQDILDAHIDEANMDPELKTLLEMTNNQYRKITKVNRDDLKIYTWLLFGETARNHDGKYDIPVSLRVAYEDRKTPVIHLYKNH